MAAKRRGGGRLVCTSGVVFAAGAGALRGGVVVVGGCYLQLTDDDLHIICLSCMLDN